MSEVEKKEAEKKPDTLCILCAHSCANQCCWADELKPVPGWVAEKSKHGYLVLECPEYVKDTYETIKPQKIHDAGMYIFLEEFGRAMREDYVYGRGPYDDYNKDKKKQDRKPKHELRALNRQLIEKWLRGPIAGKLLQLSDTDDVIDRLRKMARQYETDLMNLMRWSD